MVDKITRSQYEDIEDAFSYGTIGEFHRMLEKHTGISAIPYTAYKYFNGDDYIGDSEDFDLLNLLKNAYIEVVEDGD